MKNYYIFVPEWGWVGSGMTGDYGRGGLFSSPSGDGLVQKADLHQM